MKKFRTPGLLATIVFAVAENCFLPSTVIADDPAKSPDVAARQLAIRILDDSVPEATREAVIAGSSVDAASMIVAMTAGLPNDSKEEYRRIPWIWRVAVACGKRNQSTQIRQVLDASVPLIDQPLRDWQAVVIGGGIINGISLQRDWPKQRLEEILREHPELQKRFHRTLELAARLADNKSVPSGTRYDALRIMALDDWTLRREQIVKYLGQGVDDELQQGAISALSDIQAEDVPGLLLEDIAHFQGENRAAAIAALLRSDLRIELLLDAIAAGKLDVSLLNAAQCKSLRESKNPTIKARSIHVLGNAE